MAGSNMARTLGAALALSSLSACDQPKPRSLPPAAPDWARPMIGKPMTAFVSQSAACQGAVDRAEPRGPSGVTVHGWGWDPAAQTAPARVILTDRSGRIVGAGQGGAPRPDVPAALPAVPDADTGWSAEARRTHGPVRAYGLVAGGGAACLIGELAF